MNSLLRTRTEKESLSRFAVQLGCTPDEAKRLVKHARYRRFADGEHLAKLGSVGADVHIITNGQAHMATGDGERAVLGTGEVVGELFAYRVRHFQLANVVCDGEVETITIPLDRLERLERDCPQVAAHIESARDVRAGVVEAKSQAEALRLWEQYQQLKPYIS